MRMQFKQRYKISLTPGCYYLGKLNNHSDIEEKKVIVYCIEDDYFLIFFECGAIEPKTLKNMEEDIEIIKGININEIIFEYN